MKLLFDENISYRIVKKIAEHFHDSAHVSNFGLIHADDQNVRTFAESNQFAIVTNDSDFNEMAMLYGFPPKIIWLQTGNLRTDDIARLLIKHKENIMSFSENKVNSVLIITI